MNRIHLRFPIIFLLMAMARVVQGQSTFVGTEFAITNERYHFADPGNVIGPFPVLSILWGINVRQEVHRHFAIETGVIRKYSREGFGVSFPGSSFEMGFGGSSSEIWQFPLRLKSMFDLLDGRVMVTPSLGLHYCTNSYLGYSTGRSGTGWEGRQFQTTYRHDILRKSFVLLESGISVGTKLFNRLHLSFDFYYLTGFRKVYQFEFDYTLNDAAPQRAYGLSTGEYFRTGVTVQYRLSDFWQAHENQAEAH